MGSLTDYSELALLNHTFENAAYTRPTTVYLLLLTDSPTETGSFVNEVSGNGYARKPISFSAAASRKIVQNGQVTFDQCTGGGWGTITFWGIADALTGGNMLAYGAFSTPIVTVEGNVPFVKDLASEISITTGFASDYLSHKWLDFMFRNVAFAQPNINVALCSSEPLGSDDGSTIPELSGGSYARVDFGDWTNAVSGALSNNTSIDFPEPTAAWTTVTHSALLDSSTLGSGNLLAFGPATPNQAPGIGDPVRWPAGAYDVSLD